MAVVDVQDELGATEAGETLLSFAIAIAERGPQQVSKADYRAVHKRLFESPTAHRVGQKGVRKYATPDLLWGYLRSQATGSGSWKLRRDAAHALIDPILEALYSATEHPADELVTLAASRLNAESVSEAWSRALDRRDTNPDGAITTARTLLESTLKTILDDREVAYKQDADLPQLYKAVAKELNLSAGEHTEQAFKQILGGYNSVVVGLGSLRNKAGDAHGAGRKRYKPAARHATLAVNLAGSMALFLIETHEAGGG
jgi:Abortive infection C-terminus